MSGALPFAVLDVPAMLTKMVDWATYDLGSSAVIPNAARTHSSATVATVRHRLRSTWT